MTNLEENLQRIQDQLKTETHLIVVTKSVDSEVNRQLFNYGVRDFGENRPNGLLSKIDELADINEEINWHFIGNLQSRQVKNIINQIDYLHSLDRLSLAKEIQKRADKRVNCFLQVNVSGEESKSGFSPDNLMEQLDMFKEYDKIHIVGLMTMAPYDASPEQLHEYFARLRQLQETIQELKLPYAPCKDLSMGMSQDYQIALEEGATYIRIGTAIVQ